MDVHFIQLSIFLPSTPCFFASLLFRSTHLSPSFYSPTYTSQANALDASAIDSGSLSVEQMKAAASQKTVGASIKKSSVTDEKIKMNDGNYSECSIPRTPFPRENGRESAS